MKNVQSIIRNKFSEVKIHEIQFKLPADILSIFLYLSIPHRKVALKIYMITKRTNVSKIFETLNKKVKNLNKTHCIMVCLFYAKNKTQGNLFLIEKIQSAEHIMLKRENCLSKNEEVEFFSANKTISCWKPQILTIESSNNSFFLRIRFGRKILYVDYKIIFSEPRISVGVYTFYIQQYMCCKIIHESNNASKKIIKTPTIHYSECLNMITDIDSNMLICEKEFYSRYFKVCTTSTDEQASY